jgi:phosphodiesterase/alkaline phosphatase D-like protein
LRESVAVAAPDESSKWPKDAKVYPDGKGTVGYTPGYLTIVQCATSETETLINIFVPRLKNYTYEAIDSSGRAVPLSRYEVVTGPGFFHIHKLKISALRVGEDYTLRVLDRRTLVDQRAFRALDTQIANPRFALISCMSDDYRFNQVIDPMWERLRQSNPDFLILNGDLVYVDSFEFVERQKATESDIWQRYVDSFRRIPLYHWQRLVPVYATWDDHDFGTNDGDRDFISKDAVLRLFRAVFGGEALPGTWEPGPMGVSSVFQAFGQRFFFMDDRMFRQPNRNQLMSDPFGHWGQAQHEWLLQKLAESSAPSWIINGNQFFNGKALDFKEAFEANHPQAFVSFVQSLSAISAPVVFASGDIHLSEIMRIPADRLGYETFEFTSSCMHSFTGNGWENPMRLEGALTLEFNFMLIESQAAPGALRVSMKALGLAPDPYFEKDLVISRV